MIVPDHNGMDVGGCVIMMFAVARKPVGEAEGLCVENINTATHGADPHLARGIDGKRCYKMVGKSGAVLYQRIDTDKIILFVVVKIQPVGSADPEVVVIVFNNSIYFIVAQA